MNKRMRRVEKLDKMRCDSDDFASEDALTNFLYTIMRDCITPGKVEDIVLELEEQYENGNCEALYTNGWLGKYAEYLSQRISKLNE